jgi:hypothetical protein
MMAVPPAETGMADALAASALVAAILAALFTLWQPEVQNALDTELRDDKKNQKGARRRAQTVLRSRVWVLFVATAATLIVLLDRVRNVVAGLIGCLGRRCDYDDVQALFMLTFGLLCLLGAGVTGQVVALRRKIEELGPPK